MDHYIIISKERLFILISDKVDIRTKNITRDKEGHFMMTLMSIQLDDILITNAPNNRNLKQVKQNMRDFQGEIENPQL